MAGARFVFDMLGISLAGSVAGFALNAASPHPVPPFAPVYAAAPSATATCQVPAEAPAFRYPSMPQAEAITACADCSVGFVDARGGAAYAAGHIPGALHLPPQDHPDEALTLSRLRKFPTLVVYDDQEGCHLAQGVADRLVGAGFSDVRILEGSWTAWEAAAAPAQAGACDACGHAHGASR